MNLAEAERDPQAHLRRLPNIARVGTTSKVDVGNSVRSQEEQLITSHRSVAAPQCQFPIHSQSRTCYQWLDC